MTRKSPLKDRPSYFQKTDEGVPELSEQEEVRTSKQFDVHNPERPRRLKRTYYVREETDRILKKVQMARYEETGREPELSDLVDEAIRKLAS